MSAVDTETRAREEAEAKQHALRERHLVPFLKRLERIDSKTHKATEDLREMYFSLLAAFDGWRAMLSDEREQLKEEAVAKLDSVSGRLREGFLDAHRSFNAEGVEPLPLTLADLLRRFDGSIPSAPVTRLYRSDVPVASGFGSQTATYGAVNDA